MCLEKCPNRMYAENSNNTCTKCSDECKTCNGPN